VLRAWGQRASFAVDSGTAEVREGARRYLWRVARNLMIDEIRWRQRHRAREGEIVAAAGDWWSGSSAGGSVASPTPGPEEEFELRDCLRVIHETVDHLANDRVRRCVELWLGGSDIDRIARQRGLSAGQVRGLLQRGRSEIIRRASAQLG
jgi:RNA polymerase sigma factor (sigma-70 family)